MKKNQQSKTGVFLCGHCNNEVYGAASIRYRLEDDFVEDCVILHESCQRFYDLAKKGLVHKCPKCNGLGYKMIDTLSIWTGPVGTILVKGSDLYRHSSRYNEGKFDLVKEITKPCDLCSGQGYLEKEPIPVVTEWRKAP